MYFTDRGLEELADRRGEEQVTLAWLADQMQAFVDQFPDFEVPVERLATWLARGGDGRRRRRRDGGGSARLPRSAESDGGTLCACSVTRMPCPVSPRAPRRCPGRRSTAPSRQVAWIAAAGGFAMLPDLDQPARPSPDMWGPVTDVPSGAIGRLAQGHRWGTHDAVLGPLAFGLLAYRGRRGVLVEPAAAGPGDRPGPAGAALRHPRPRREHRRSATSSCPGAAPGCCSPTVPSPAWLPWAVALGCLTHIAGDALTTAGVPVPLLWIVKRQPAEAAADPHRRRRGEGGPRPAVPAWRSSFFLYLNTEAARRSTRWWTLLSLG